MNILDIIVLVILALFLLIGLWKGFLRTLLSLFGNVASLVVAVLVAKPVAKFLDGFIHLTELFSSKISGMIQGFIPTELDITVATRGQVIDSLDCSELLRSLIAPFIPQGPYTTASALSSTVGESLGALATIVLTVIVLFILIKIAVALLGKLFDAITKSGAISGLDRLLGAVCGLIKGCIIVFAGLSILYTLNSLPFISSWFDGLVNESTIAMQIYKYIQDFFAWVVQRIDLTGVISSWLGTNTGGGAGAEGARALLTIFR